MDRSRLHVAPPPPAPPSPSGRAEAPPRDAPAEAAPAAAPLTGFTLDRLNDYLDERMPRLQRLMFEHRGVRDGEAASALRGWSRIRRWLDVSLTSGDTAR